MKKYKIILVVLTAVLIITSAGCLKRPNHPKGLGPTEVVLQYIEYINQENALGVQSLHTEPEKIDVVSLLKESEFIQVSDCICMDDDLESGLVRVRLFGEKSIINRYGREETSKIDNVYWLQKCEDGEWRISKWGFN